MKTRKGFVSNSSTSSFVLLGFDATGLFDDIEEASKRLGFNYSYCDEEEPIVIGEIIAEHTDEDYGLWASTVDVFSVIGKVTEIKTKLEAETPIRVWMERTMG